MSDAVVGERRMAWLLEEYELDSLSRITVEWDGKRWWQLVTDGQRIIGFPERDYADLFFSEREALTEQLRRYQAEYDSIGEAIQKIRQRLGESEARG